MGRDTLLAGRSQIYNFRRDAIVLKVFCLPFKKFSTAVEARDKQNKVFLVFVGILCDLSGQEQSPGGGQIANQRARR